MWVVIIPALGLIVFYVWRTVRSSNVVSVENTSLDAYISKDSKLSSEHAECKDVDIDKHYHRSYQDIGRQILVFYGTEYGFSEELAKKLFDRIYLMEIEQKNEYPWQPRLVNAKDYKFVDFSKETICFLVISTSGDGVPPTEARAFYESMMTSSEELSHFQYSVLALGDSSYPHYCRTGRTLHDRLEKRGAVPIIKCQDVDQEDWTVIGQWMDHVISVLVDISILPGLDYLEIDLSEDKVKFSRHQPYMATVVVKEALTVVNEAGDKETVHLELDVGEHLNWTAGDAVGIYPENNPADVADILTTLGLSGDIKIDTPTLAYKPRPEKVSLSEALLRYLNIKHVQPSLLQLLHLESPSHHPHLHSMLKNGTSKENTELHSYLSIREVKDVVREFSPPSLSVSNFLSTLRPLLPRYYSISSSPVINPGKISVTAAVVRYTTLGINRSGVTTSELQDRIRVGDTCPVFISHNDDFRLPSNTSVPLILIGPGTGIAPFRAFIQERELVKDRGQIFLYFGCRHRDKDFLYRLELENLSDAGVIMLRTAFSRDQDEKIYVQDLLIEDSVILWNLLNQGAVIYVCGDARHMARDVHSALSDIVQGQGHMTKEDAQRYLLDLENNHRYQKDVWVT